MVQRQALGRLHHTEHDLACDHAFLGHAVVAHICLLLRQSCCADGGHVVEHHSQILIDQRAQQAGHDLVDFFLVIDQCVHGAQQVLVVNGLGHDAWQSDRLQPTQHTEFRFWITQPVEHHHANECLDIDGVAGRTKHLAQTIKAQ